MSVVGTVAAAVTYYFTQTPQLAMMAYTIGSGAEMLMNPPQMEGPRLGDLRPQGSEYGRAIPIVYGTVGLAGNVIWQTDLVEVASESGGKGGPEVRNYTYYANFAVLVCEGEVEFGRIWAGPEKRLIWDGATLEGGGNITFYTGTEDQMPDPLMESHLGAGNVPAYRGYAYIVFENFPVANDANRIPFLQVEVGRVSTVTTLGLGIEWSNTRAFVNNTTNRYIWTYVGSYDGAMQRQFGNDPLVANPDALVHNVPFDSGYLRGAFYDKDRNVCVYISSFFNVWVVNFTTSSQEFNPAGLSLSGYVPSGGIYHNGLYVLLYVGTYLNGGRKAIVTVEPDTLTIVDTFYDDGSEPEFFAGELFHRYDSDNYILAWCSDDSTIRKIPITTAGWSSTIIDTGASAVNPFTNNTYSQDPYTGYIWTAYWDGTNVNYVVTDPVTETTIAEGAIGASAWEMASFVFTPTKVILIMEKWLATDYFVLWDPNGASPTTVEGIYHGTGSISVGWYNPLLDMVFFVRDYHYVNTSGGTSATNFSLNAIGLWGNTGALGFDLNSAGVSLTIDGQPLDEVVQNLCERAGLESAEINVTALASDEVDGYAIAQQTTVRGAIQALMPAFNFDAVESGGIAKFVKRGGAVVVSIPDADLCAYKSGSQPETDLVQTTRKMEDELPVSVSVTYINRNADYDNMTKQSRRLVGGSGDEQNFGMPIVMSDTKAQGVADTLLHQAWVARKTYTFSLPLKYAYLEPTDVVLVREQTMVLTRVTQSDGVLKCEGVFDDFNYVPHVVVTETPTSGKEVYVPSPTILELM